LVVVNARSSPLGAACIALALAAVSSGGCERAERPPSALSTAPMPAAVDGPRASDAVAGASAPAASARKFDVGEVKSAAEYLRDPEFTNADLKRGQLLSLACAACHTLGADEKTIVGPNLHGVFGRRAAAVEGFDYSPALRDSGLVWTPRALEAWLADPASFVAGTKMTFTGYRSAEDRRDLIAYLLHATQ
jgi:cytochrome c